uniref:Uncharacterized protein n=1 Tax=Zea mays TaxID=4577 RepID=C4J831_MAIZE|nr:unknown [Zea mays]
MYRDSSPTRYSTVDARSFSGSSHLRRGITSAVAFSAFSLPTDTGNLSCRCRPRQAALTLILCFPSSIAHRRTNWWMAPKLVPYAAAPGYNPLSAPII